MNSGKYLSEMSYHRRIHQNDLHTISNILILMIRIIPLLNNHTNLSSVFFNGDDYWITQSIFFCSLFCDIVFHKTEIFVGFEICPLSSERFFYVSSIILEGNYVPTFQDTKWFITVLSWDILFCVIKCGVVWNKTKQDSHHMKMNLST